MLPAESRRQDTEEDQACISRFAHDRPRSSRRRSRSAVAASIPTAAVAQDEVTPGGTLVVAADSEPVNLNPAMVASNGVFFVSSKVVEPLAEMDTSGTLRPLLATSWQGSEDGSTFTVNLREGVTWHDGEPFTSADVAFSAMEVWKAYGNLGRSFFANLESVDTPDDHTAVFNFSKPMPSQLFEIAMPALTAVVPEHILAGTELANPDAPNPYNLAPVGTGPFVFSEYRPGELYRLTAYDDYWDDDKPYLDEIIFQFLPDAAAKAAALETGDIDLTAFSAIPLLDLPRLDALEGVSAITEGYEGLTYAITLDFNHRNEILANPDVRKAIRMAVDPQVIVDTVFQASVRARPRAPSQDRSHLLYPGRDDLRVRPGGSRGAARRSRLSPRRGRHPLRAAAAAGALLRRDARHG